MMVVKPVKETIVQEMDMMVLQTLLKYFLSVRYIRMETLGINNMRELTYW